MSVSYDSAKASVVALKSTARISIYEFALLDHTAQASPTNIVFDHKRTNHLMAYLHSCKEFTEQYLNLDLINITTPTCFAFAYCIRNLSKLATLSNAGWDQTIVLQTVDIIGLLDLCAANADKVNVRLKEKLGEDSVFAMAAKSVRDSAPRNWRTPSTEPQGSGDALTEEWTSTEGLDTSFVDFSDEFWLNTLFRP